MVLALALTLVASQPKPTFELATGLDAGRALLEVPYAFGGRTPLGVDCLGLIFAVAERATGCGWKSYSVNPTQLVEQKVLGEPVPEFGRVIRKAELDTKALHAGDVVMLVQSTENPAEPSIGELDGRPVWVWHTGIATGEGKWLVGDHLAGHVIEVDLREYLDRTPYTGAVILRGPVQKPKPCRVNAPIVPREARRAGG